MLDFDVNGIVFIKKKKKKKKEERIVYCFSTEKKHGSSFKQI